jgi:EmrB/QacA subfamily drug resistance transporter
LPATARPAWTLGAVCLATFMLLLDVSVVVVALPSMRADLGGTFADAQWVLDAYTLALAGLIMAGAVLADRLGRRRIFATGVGIFTLSSAACALADAPLALNVGRGVQGLGGGLVLATAIPLIANAYTGARRAAAIGAWAATVGLAVAVGPLVGGLLTDGLGWRWIFLVNVPLGMAALAVVRPAIAESFGPQRPLDPLGIGLLTAGLAALIFATVRGGPEGWGSPVIVSAFALGVAAMVGFVAVELRAAAPVLDLRLLRNGRLAAFVLGAFTLGAGFLGVFVEISAFHQGGLGASPVHAGLRMLPMTTVYAVTAVLAGRLLLPRVELVTLLGTAMGSIAAGLLLMRLIGPHNSWTMLLPGSALAGVGWGIVNPVTTEGALAAVEPAQAAMASGMVSFSRTAGFAAGVAAIGATFHHAVEERLGAGSATADAVASGATAHLTSGLAPVDAAGLQDAAHAALAHGIDVAALVGAAIIVAGTAASVMLAHGRRSAHTRVGAPAPRPAAG